MTTVSFDPRRGNADFQRVASSFLLEKGLPLGSVLPAAEIERIFRRHDGLFGDTYNGVYNTTVVLWAFLAQVLADGKMRSCAAAVARVIDFSILTGQAPPSPDTSVYCKARYKLNESALYELVTETATKIELAAPDEWLWCGRHAKLVDGFTAEAHPEFRLSLLQPQGKGGAHGWSEKRVRMSEAAMSETSNLKFTHTTHLDPEKVQEESSGEALVCASCHALKDDGEHFEPITMDNHCRSCHGLSFDVFDPELELPHGDLRAAVVAMEAHFIREFTDPVLRQQRAETKPRRVPGKRDSAANCEGNGLDCGRAEALKEAEYQFANTGCISCHVVLDTGLEDINDRWFVQPVRITNDWYPLSRFDHASHLSQDWDESREVCESCHEASGSDASADILIPGQDNCLACHAEDSGRSVAVDCVSCHAFHLESGSPSSTARMEGTP